MLLLQIVATMQVFIEPLILANGAGAQDSATSVAYLIYQHAFLPERPQRRRRARRDHARGAGRLLGRLRAADREAGLGRRSTMAAATSGPGPSISPAQLSRAGAASHLLDARWSPCVVGVHAGLPRPAVLDGHRRAEVRPGDRADPADAVPAATPAAATTPTRGTTWTSAKLLFNTFYYAIGALLFQLVFDIAAAYALSKLRPVFGNVDPRPDAGHADDPGDGADRPAVRDRASTCRSCTSTCSTSPWAIWLPAVANAFNIFLLKRFFDSIPDELLAGGRDRRRRRRCARCGRSSCRCRARSSAWSRSSR